MIPRMAAWEAAVLPLNYAGDGVATGGAGSGRQGGGSEICALRRELVQDEAELVGEAAVAIACYTLKNAVLSAERQRRQPLREAIHGC